MAGVLNSFRIDRDEKIDKLNETERVLKKACEQIILLNNKIVALTKHYNRAKADGYRSFRYNLRVRLAVVEGVRNVFYEYARDRAEDVADLRKDLYNQNVTIVTDHEDSEFEPVDDDDDDNVDEDGDIDEDDVADETFDIHDESDVPDEAENEADFFKNELDANLEDVEACGGDSDYDASEHYDPGKKYVHNPATEPESDTATDWDLDDDTIAALMAADDDSGVDA